MGVCESAAPRATLPVTPASLSSRERERSKGLARAARATPRLVSDPETSVSECRAPASGPLRRKLPRRRGFGRTARWPRREAFPLTRRPVRIRDGRKGSSNPAVPNRWERGVAQSWRLRRRVAAASSAVIRIIWTSLGPGRRAAEPTSCSRDGRASSSGPRGLSRRSGRAGATLFQTSRNSEERHAGRRGRLQGPNADSLVLTTRRSRGRSGRADRWRVAMRAAGS
jgi:hypothetical protein